VQTLIQEQAERRGLLPVASQQSKAQL